MNMNFNETIKPLMDLLHTVMVADIREVIGIVTLVILAGGGKKYLTKIKNDILTADVDTNTRFINDQLAMACGSSNADRVVFFVFKGEVSITNKTLTSFCTHDSVRAGIASYAKKNDKRLISDYEPFLDLLLANDYISYSDVTHEIANKSLKTTLTGLGIVSISTHIVLNHKGAVVGYISAEYVNRKKDRPEAIVKDALYVCSNVIGSVVSRSI